MATAQISGSRLATIAGLVALVTLRCAAVPSAWAQTPPTPEPGVPQTPIGRAPTFARAGQLMLGGGFGVTTATDTTIATLSPRVGWFPVNNFELSAIARLDHSDLSGVRTTIFTGLLEPSVHVYFTDATLGFAGLGVGPFVAKLPEATSTAKGLALVPRVGVDILIGKSGVFSPEISLVYSTASTVASSQGTALSTRTALGIGAGYSVVW